MPCPKPLIRIGADLDDVRGNPKEAFFFPPKVTMMGHFVAVALRMSQYLARKPNHKVFAQLCSVKFMLFLYAWKQFEIPQEQLLNISFKTSIQSKLKITQAIIIFAFNEK